MAFNTKKQHMRSNYLRKIRRMCGTENLRREPTADEFNHQNSRHRISDFLDETEDFRKSTISDPENTKPKFITDSLLSGHNVEITRLNRKPDLTPSFLLKKRQEGNENISTSVSNRYDRTLTDENETAEAVHTSNEANNLVQAQIPQQNIEQPAVSSDNMLNYSTRRIQSRPPIRSQSQTVTPSNNISTHTRITKPFETTSYLPIREIETITESIIEPTGMRKSIRTKTTLFEKSVVYIIPNSYDNQLVSSNEISADFDVEASKLVPVPKTVYDSHQHSRYQAPTIYKHDQNMSNAKNDSDNGISGGNQRNCSDESIMTNDSDSNENYPNFFDSRSESPKTGSSHGGQIFKKVDKSTQTIDNKTISEHSIYSSFDENDLLNQNENDEQSSRNSYKFNEKRKSQKNCHDPGLVESKSSVNLHRSDSNILPSKRFQNTDDILLEHFPITQKRLQKRIPHLQRSIFERQNESVGQTKHQSRRLKRLENDENLVVLKKLMENTSSELRPSRLRSFNDLNNKVNRLASVTQANASPRRSTRVRKENSELLLRQRLLNGL